MPSLTEVVCGHHDLVAVLRVDPLQRPPPEGVPRDVPDHASVVDEVVQLGKLVNNLKVSPQLLHPKNSSQDLAVARFARMRCREIHETSLTRSAFGYPPPPLSVDII